MSLYYEAAAILANVENTGGSLKSRIYTKKDLKSSPGQIFALIAEASKWSVVLKDVIEKCGLLAEERKVLKQPTEDDVKRRLTRHLLSFY
jgi:putative methyltransferase